jgi:Domain of unknown function (DUF4160)
MPTVLRHGRVRIVIYLADHRPAHVHVMGPDGEAVFNLNCRNGPCELRENYGLKTRTLNDIERLINKHVNELCGAWEGFHGIA